LGASRSDELAGATGSHAPSLHRLLRALASLAICREREDGSFELMPMGDLHMLVGPGGRERTEREFRTLLGSAGLRLNRVIPIGSNYAISEAVAA
jgi:hypothetical protein